MKQIFSLTVFIVILLTLNACKQTDKSIPIVEETDETTLFTSEDLRNAIEVKELSTEELYSLDSKNDENGIELSFLDEDEVESELDTQGVIKGASGWLALYRVKDSNGLNQIRLHDQSNDKNRVTVYSDVDAVGSVAVSEDGNTVVAAIVNPAHTNNRKDIYLFDLSVSPKKVYQLTNNSNRNESNVSITADGLKIAYERKRKGIQTPYICTYNPKKHKCSTSFITDPDSLNQIQPSLSANGQYLVVVKLLNNGNHQVGLYDLTASPNPKYTSIRTRKDVLAHPSVNDLGTQVMYLWERNSNGKDYIRIKDLTGPSYSTEFNGAGIDHPFIARYASHTTYQQFNTSSNKYQVKTKKISNNATADPQGGAWEYFSSSWMMSSCGMGTTVTGNQILSTQADVDALEGVSTITGSLLIDPFNTSLDLSPLYLLTDVTDNLQLDDNSIQTTLSGFECLTMVGGFFSIASNDNLSSIGDFPLLASVGSFQIYSNDNLNSIGNFPLLAITGLSFSIFNNNNLSSIGNFPLLASTGSSFGISGNNNLSSIGNFPLLASVGHDFYISSNYILSNIPDFPLLASVGNTFQYL